MPPLEVRSHVLESASRSGQSKSVRLAELYLAPSVLRGPLRGEAQPVGTIASDCFGLLAHAFDRLVDGAWTHFEARDQS